MNDYKEVIYFDSISTVYFNDVSRYSKDIVFGRSGTRVIYSNKTHQISFKYINDAINGNHIIVSKYRCDTLEDVPFKKGELEKFYFTNISM